MSTSTITVERAWSGGQFEKNAQDSDSSTATLYYIVRGVSTEEAAISALEDTLNISDGADLPTYQGIPYRSASVEERLTEDSWKVAAKYQTQDDSSGDSSDDDDDEEDIYNFDISSGTRKIVVPLESVNKYPSDAPKSQGINDGEGVDIMMPVFHFSETHSLSSLSTSKKTKIAELVGCVNSGSFKGYSAGEVLFTGCSGTKTGKDKWRVTFSFSVCKNQTGIKIGDISGIKKDGWDIIWVRYKEESKTESSKKKIIKVAKAAYVERVYERKSFGGLGIGN